VPAACRGTQYAATGMAISNTDSHCAATFDGEDCVRVTAADVVYSLELLKKAAVFAVDQGLSTFVKVVGPRGCASSRPCACPTIITSCCGWPSPHVYSLDDRKRRRQARHRTQPLAVGPAQAVADRVDRHGAGPDARGDPRAAAL
jgi:hypothetical protein